MKIEINDRVLYFAIVLAVTALINKELCAQMIAKLFK